MLGHKPQSCIKQMEFEKKKNNYSFFKNFYFIHTAMFHKYCPNTRQIQICIINNETCKQDLREASEDEIFQFLAIKLVNFIVCSSKLLKISWFRHVGQFLRLYFNKLLKCFFLSMYRWMLQTTQFSQYILSYASSTSWDSVLHMQRTVHIILCDSKIVGIFFSSSNICSMKW